MVINVMNYLTLILLVLALCASFPTNTQATNSLSEKFSKCEKEFWFKNLSHYKQSLKSKCLNEKKHHQNEKRHRQKHTCHNKSLDKKIILKKWKEYSNCRCESAIEELKNTKESKVLTCYQIAKFNKVSGKFIGQLTVFKKKSDKHDYDVAVKFSNVKLLNNKEGGYYRSKKSNQICNDQFTIETYYIKGKISKKESMNKISLNRISPSSIKIIDKDNEETITLPNGQQVSIPFPKFGLNDDDKNNNIENPPEKNPKDSKDPKKSPTAPPVDPAGPSSPTKPSDPSDPSSNKPPSDSDSPTSPPASPGDNTNTPGYNTNTPDDSNNTPDDSTNTPGGSTDTSGGNTENKSSTPEDDESSANTVVSPAAKSVTSSNQEASVNQQGAPFTGLLVFGIIVSVGAAFVGYNTYERIKWRRHFRRGQAAAAQLNPSLANVPDYNGYGRAY